MTVNTRKTLRNVGTTKDWPHFSLHEVLWMVPGNQSVFTANFPLGQTRGKQRF